MKIDIPLLESLMSIGITLLVRAQAQGIEQALLATAVEFSVNGARAAARFLRFAA